MFVDEGRFVDDAGDGFEFVATSLGRISFGGITLHHKTGFTLIGAAEGGGDALTGSDGPEFVGDRIGEGGIGAGGEGNANRMGTRRRGGSVFVVE